MKKSATGCLGWLFRIIGGTIFAVVLSVVAYNYSYQHIIPFQKFVDTFEIQKKIDTKVSSAKGSIRNVKIPAFKNSDSTVSVEAPKDVLRFEHKKQLVMGKLDVLGRATYSHIQLKSSDKPQAKREARLTYNPSGWHNYKFSYSPSGKKTWVMNRGHLVGYQFCGLNDEPRNLITETAWMNQGDFDGMDDSNEQSMLYYENRLNQWLLDHPNDYLDYKVTPIYTGSELVARQVKLEYVGITSAGQFEQIRLGGSLEQSVIAKCTVVLENVAPNITIDYQTGRATQK
jgi:DNA-entry nuclease